jgi:hypothetical protein
VAYTTLSGEDVLNRCSPKMRVRPSKRMILVGRKVHATTLVEVPPSGPQSPTPTHWQEHLSMSKLTDQQDAWGHAMHDAYMGKPAHEVYERDDGLVSVADSRRYVKESRYWQAWEKSGLKFARGKVLDLGCGAGRTALYLQQQGLDVLGIDNSPLAIKVCKLRGPEKAKAMSITEVSYRLGTFDTLLLFGFGLLGSFGRARWLLRLFRRMTSDQARIIAVGMDPYQTKARDHLAYHRRNRRRGRMAGQIRLRARYGRHATPWFDHLMVSKSEMAEIVDGTGWGVGRFIGPEGPGYIAVIEKER